MLCIHILISLVASAKLLNNKFSEISDYDSFKLEFICSNMIKQIIY